MIWSRTGQPCLLAASRVSKKLSWVAQIIDDYTPLTRKHYNEIKEQGYQRAMNEINAHFELRVRHTLSKHAQRMVGALGGKSAK